MAKYPAQLDNTTSLPTAVDNITPVAGSLFNKLRDAVISVETELGIKPSGVNTNVRSRLEVLDSSLDNLQIIKLDGDLGGTLDEPKVIGINGKLVSDVEPNYGDILTWNGLAWTPDANKDIKRIQSLGSKSGNVNFDLGSGPVIEFTMIGDCVIQSPLYTSVANESFEFTLIIKQDGSGSHNLSFSSSFSGTNFAVNPTANSLSCVTFQLNTSGKWVQSGSSIDDKVTVYIKPLGSSQDDATQIIAALTSFDDVVLEEGNWTVGASINMRLFSNKTLRGKSKEKTIINSTIPSGGDIDSDVFYSFIDSIVLSTTFNTTPGTTSVNTITVNGLLGSTTTSSFTQPAIGSNIQIHVSLTTDKFVVGQRIFINTAGYYKITSIDSSTVLTIQNLGSSGNKSPGTIISITQRVIGAVIELLNDFSGNGKIGGTYLVTKISGSGPYTITLDRDIIWYAFSIGDSIIVRKDFLENLTIENFTITGTGRAFCEFQGSKNCKINDILAYNYVPGSQIITNFTKFGFKNSIINCEIDGGLASNNGFNVNQQEQFIFDNCFAHNFSYPGSGILVGDSSGKIINCQANNCGLFGLLSYTNAVSGGCFDLLIDGGNYDSNGVPGKERTGLSFYGSGGGISIDGNATQVVIKNVTSRHNPYNIYLSQCNNITFSGNNNISARTLGESPTLSTTYVGVYVGAAAYNVQIAPDIIDTSNALVGIWGIGSGGEPDSDPGIYLSNHIHNGLASDSSDHGILLSERTVRASKLNYNFTTAFACIHVLNGAMIDIDQSEIFADSFGLYATGAGSRIRIRHSQCTNAHADEGTEIWIGTDVHPSSADSSVIVDGDGIFRFGDFGSDNNNGRYAIDPGAKLLDSIPKTFRISGEAPFSAATGANRTSGSLELATTDSVGGVTTFGTVDVLIGNALQWRFDKQALSYKGGTSPAATGLIRVPKSITILASRNSGDSGDVTNLSSDSSGNLVVGSVISITMSSTCTITSGANSPEGVVTAPIGSLFLRTNGGATTSLYVKTSGSGNTGWTAK